MSDDNVVDIKSRVRRKDNPRVWEIAKQLIAMEDIREVVAVLADVSSEFPEVQLLRDIPNSPKSNERVHNILWEAVGRLEQFEDSLKETSHE